MYRFKECKGLVKICKAPDRCLFNYVPKFHFFDHYSDWLLGIKNNKAVFFKKSIKLLWETQSICDEQYELRMAVLLLMTSF